MAYSLINTENGMCNTQNIFIIVLVILLIFSYLGINLFVVIGNILQPIFNFFISILDGLLSVLGVSFGSLIIVIADMFRDLGVWFLNLFFAIIHDITTLLFIRPTQGSGYQQPPPMQQQQQQQPPQYNPNREGLMNYYPSSLSSSSYEAFETMKYENPFESLINSNSVHNVEKTLQQIGPFLHP